MSNARNFADLVPTLNSITSSLVTVSQQPYLQFEQDISFSASAPVTASVGTLWTDTTDATAPILKVYNGTTWIEMSGAGGGGGMKTSMMLMGS
jgi:hypothetical protein